MKITIPACFQRDCADVYRRDCFDGLKKRYIWLAKTGEVIAKGPLNFKNPMKKLSTLFLVFVVFQSWSQGFEGIVKWTMKMEITDPKMKADMDRAQQQMNDPSTQAQMKEMEEKMKDPQFKAMMEANPQMKAQMENMMKMAQGGNMNPNAMMPKGMTIKVKGGSTLSRMEGGMMDGKETLHLKDKGTYMIDRANKTYSQLPAGGGAQGPKPEVKVTKTSETEKILGYNCVKYLAEVTERGQVITQTFWTTTEIKDMDFKSLARQRMGQGGGQMFYEEMEGIPLKMIMASKGGNMIMEVAEINREPVSADDVSLPAGFTETKYLGR